MVERGGGDEVLGRDEASRSRWMRWRPLRM